MTCDEPICTYCLSPTLASPPPFSSATLLTFGCACKGSCGTFHVHCKAKFARIKTLNAMASSSRGRGDAARNAEWGWMNCEICNSPMRNGEAVICLARERHLQCFHEMRMHEGGMDAGVFWREMVMSACFFATTIVKKCKDCTASIPAKGVPFWVESCNTLSSTIQLVEQLQSSPMQIALLWCLEMKFVDCLYYVFQMMMDRSSSLEENEAAFIETVKRIEKYNLRFGMLAVSMCRLKKFAEDVVIKTGGKRDENGTIVLTVEENAQFEKMKGVISREMKMANEAGGVERQGLGEELSYQVEFVNFETYGKHVEKESSK